MRKLNRGRMEYVTGDWIIITDAKGWTVCQYSRLTGQYYGRKVRFNRDDLEYCGLTIDDKPTDSYMLNGGGCPCYEVVMMRCKGRVIRVGQRVR